MAAPRILLLGGSPATSEPALDPVGMLSGAFPDCDVVADPDLPLEEDAVACVVAVGGIDGDATEVLAESGAPLVYVGDPGDRVPAGVLAATGTDCCVPADADDPAAALVDAVGDAMGRTDVDRGGRRTFEYLPDPAYVTDTEGRIQAVNAAFRDRVGSVTGDVVGNPVGTALPFEDSPDDGRREVTVGDGDAARTYELEERTTETGSVGVLRDVTDREARRERLRTIEQRYRRMVEQDLFGIYIIQQGKIRFANRRAAEMFGYEPAEMVDEMTAFDVVAESDHERLAENIRRREEGEVTDLRYELTGVRKDGTRFEFEVHSGVVEYEGETALLGAIIDITERKRRRQRLRVLNRVLRHNLRNDLNVVIGRLEDAVHRLREHGDDRGADVVTSGLDEARALVSTSEKLRKIQETLERDPGEEPAIDAVESVERVTATAREAYPAATIRTDLPDRAPVRADRAFELVVENLVENALEHGATGAPDSDGPVVEVSVAELDRDRGDWYELRVADDGPGIPEQEQVVVDESVEVTPLQHSSGVGLWTVAWVVQSFDGDVDIDTGGGGTAVTVGLRAAR
jgi:PAS domain S-box-containing protein